MKKSRTIIIIMTLCFCMLISCAGPCLAAEGSGHGYGFSSGAGSYGSRISGGVSWNGDHYTGWAQGSVTINNSTSSCWFYIVNDEVQTGWVNVKGFWYYLNDHGIMHTGWIKYNRKWYYLMPVYGYMVTGWNYISGKWYYMDWSGAMTTGWQYYNGNWYYMDASGVMVTGRQKIDGKYYYFTSNGKCIG